MKRYNIDGLPGLTMQGKKGTPGERGCMTFCNVMNVYELNSKYNYAIGIEDIDGVLGTIVFPANGVKPIVGDYVIDVLQRVSNLYEIDGIYEFTKEELSSYGNEYSEEENTEDSIDGVTAEEVVRGNIINLITHLKKFENVVKELKSKETYKVFHLNLLNQWLYNEGLTSKDSDISILTQTYNVERTPWKGEYTPKYLNKEISYISSPFSYFAHIKTPGKKVPVFDNPEQTNDIVKFFKHYGNLANYYTDIFGYDIDNINQGFICDKESKKYIDENEKQIYLYPWINVTSKPVNEYPRIKTQLIYDSYNVLSNSDDRVFVNDNGATNLDIKTIINAINDEESETFAYTEYFNENTTVLNLIQKDPNNTILSDESEIGGHHLSFLTIRLLNSLDLKEETTETEDATDNEMTVEIQPYISDSEKDSVEKEKEHNPYIVQTTKIDAATDSNYISDKNLKEFKENFIYKISPTSNVNKKTVDVTIYLGKHYFNYNGITLPTKEVIEKNSDGEDIIKNVEYIDKYTTLYDAVNINKEISGVTTNYTFNRYQIEVQDIPLIETNSFDKSNKFIKDNWIHTTIQYIIKDIHVLDDDNNENIIAYSFHFVKDNNEYYVYHYDKKDGEGNDNISTDFSTIISDISSVNVYMSYDKQAQQSQEQSQEESQEASDTSDYEIDSSTCSINLSELILYALKENKIAINGEQIIISFDDIISILPIYTPNNNFLPPHNNSIKYHNITTCIKYTGVETDSEGKIKLPIISAIPTIEINNNNDVTVDNSNNVFAYVEVQYHNENKDNNSNLYYKTYPFYRGITLFDKLFYKNNCLDCYLLPRDFYLTNKDNLTELIGVTYITGEENTKNGLIYTDVSNYYWNKYTLPEGIEENTNLSFVEENSEIPLGGLFRTINGFILYYDSNSPSKYDELSVLKNYDFVSDTIIKDEDEDDITETKETSDEDNNKSIIEYIDEYNNKKLEKIPYSLTQFLLKSSMSNKTLKNIKIEVELFKNTNTKVMNVSSCIDKMWDTTKYASDTCNISKNDNSFEFPKNAVMQAMYDQYMKMSHSYSVITDKISRYAISPMDLLRLYYHYLNNKTYISYTPTEYLENKLKQKEEENILKYAYSSNTDFNNIEISSPFMLGKISRMGWSKNYDNTLNFDNEDIFPCTLLLKDYGEEFSNGQFVSSIMLPKELMENCAMKIYAYIKSSSLSATKVLIGETMMEETY